MPVQAAHATQACVVDTKNYTHYTLAGNHLMLEPFRMQQFLMYYIWAVHVHTYAAGGRLPRLAQFVIDLGLYL